MVTVVASAERGSLMVEASNVMSTAQFTLVVVGALLAVAAAVVTSIVADQRGKEKGRLDEQIDEQERKVTEARSALASSLSTERSVVSFWAFVEATTRRGEPRYDQHLFTAATWLAQAAADAAPAAGIDFDPDAPEKTPTLQAIFDLQRSARTLGPAALSSLMKISTEMRHKLLDRNNEAVRRLTDLVQRRGRYEARTSWILSIGTSIQILSLIVIAMKDLL